jgi:hypothetical protein
MIYYTEEEGHALREAFEREVLVWPKVETRLMFGCPAYIAEGRLFAFLVNDGIVITQIRKRDRETLSEDFHTEPFTAGEREIARWQKVHLESVKRLRRILPYVKKSYELILSH